ncbi:MAG TPA: hypothetical protein VJJ75_01345 [Candidatus Nanoarchaeia archaeon]|nr:hypothetical protein [Candidatus Nanoarchaeia archaeon]
MAQEMIMVSKEEYERLKKKSHEDEEDAIAQIHKGLDDIKQGKLYKRNPKTGKLEKIRDRKMNIKEHLKNVLDDVKKGRMRRFNPKTGKMENIF